MGNNSSSKKHVDDVTTTMKQNDDKDKVDAVPIELPSQTIEDKEVNFIKLEPDINSSPIKSDGPLIDIFSRGETCDYVEKEASSVSVEDLTNLTTSHDDESKAAIISENSSDDKVNIVSSSEGEHQVSTEIVNPIDDFKESSKATASSDSSNESDLSVSAEVVIQESAVIIQDSFLEKEITADSKEDLVSGEVGENITVVDSNEGSSTEKAIERNEISEEVDTNAESADNIEEGEKIIQYKDSTETVTEDKENSKNVIENTEIISVLNSDQQMEICNDMKVENELFGATELSSAESVEEARNDRKSVTVNSDESGEVETNEVEAIIEPFSVKTSEDSNISVTESIDTKEIRNDDSVIINTETAEIITQDSADSTSEIKVQESVETIKVFSSEVIASSDNSIAVSAESKEVEKISEASESQESSLNSTVITNNTEIADVPIVTISETPSTIDNSPVVVTEDSLTFSTDIDSTIAKSNETSSNSETVNISEVSSKPESSPNQNDSQRRLSFTPNDESSFSESKRKSSYAPIDTSTIRPESFSYRNCNYITDAHYLLNLGFSLKYALNELTITKGDIKQALNNLTLKVMNESCKDGVFYDIKHIWRTPISLFIGTWLSNHEVKGVELKNGQKKYETKYQIDMKIIYYDIIDSVSLLNVVEKPIEPNIILYTIHRTYQEFKQLYIKLNDILLKFLNKNLTDLLKNTFPLETLFNKLIDRNKDNRRNNRLELINTWFNELIKLPDIILLYELRIELENFLELPNKIFSSIINETEVIATDGQLTRRKSFLQTFNSRFNKSIDSPKIEKKEDKGNDNDNDESDNKSNRRNSLNPFDLDDEEIIGESAN